MNHNEMLAMMNLLSEKQNWVAKDAKWKPPVGFFTQDPETLVAGLLAAPGGKAKAMSRLNFYINRAGEKLKTEDAERLETAKTKLKKLKEDAIRLAQLAGLILEDKEDGDPALDLDEELPADEKTEEDDIESLYKKLAKQIKESDDEEAIIEFIKQVYEAGKKDAKEDKKSKKKDDESSEDSEEEVKESSIES